MAVAGSLQLSHGWSIHKQHRVCGHCNQFKMIMVRKGQAHLLGFRLSSNASLQDAWRFHLSNNLCRSLHPVSSRPNAFMCQSFLMPGQASETPILKVVTSALTRLCKNYQGNPLILKLAPAVAIMAFAVWGLGPLMRRGRKLFFHRSDSNWKKSRTYHVLTSYLQPLLLWAGATLICRVLDPVTLPSEASQAVKQRLLNFVRSLSTVMAFAYCLSSLIQQAQKFFMETNDSNNTRNMGFQFAGRAVYTAVWVAAFSLFMELLGFSTQKWVTAGGLGTVLLTLAGREIFTNFLSSVMIHATRPFVANEWIQTKVEGYEVSGTVEHVGWWSPTIIRGEDREAIHIPNHKFTVNVVRNLSQKTHWRVKTHLAISHLDVNKINNIVADMRKVLAKNPQVEQQRLHRRVFLDNINPENQALFILVSCFVKTSHFEEYLCVKEAILMDLLRVISHHRARLATPIRTIQKIYGDANVENVPFSETIFTRAGATTNRPFLLIEHSSKINSDDKAKSRQTRQSEDQEAKGASTSDSKVPSPTSDISAASGSDNKPTKKASSGDARPKSSKVDSVPIASTSRPPPKLHLDGSDSVAQNSDGAVPSGPGNKPSKKANSGEAHSKGSKVNSVPPVATASMPPPNSQFNGLDSMGLHNKDITPQTTDIATQGSAHMKHGSERLPVTPPSTARPTLQENIVLGVALGGSKRTLPIEEGMTTSPAPVETKERVAFQNASGSLSAGKDKKEGQTRVVPGAAVNELRDQER